MSTYQDKLAGIMNTTLVGLALTLSKDVRILQVLLEAQKPLTSHEIAGERHLKERYVRELVGSLATAEIIHVSTDDAGSLVYYLIEDEKKALRTRLLPLTFFPFAMIEAYDQIKSCLSQTGPYGFKISKEFHDCIEEYGPYNFDGYLAAIMKSVDGFKTKLESGIEVMEVGSGRGRLLAKIAQMFPKCVFTATDNVTSLLDQLKVNLGHIPNIECAILDLCSTSNLPCKQYDWVYCVNVINYVPNPQAAFTNIRKLAKPGGVFTMIEFATSGSPISDRGQLPVAGLYAFGAFMAIPETLQSEDSQGLGFCGGKQKVVDLLTAAGFTVDTVDLGNIISLFVCHKSIPWQKKSVFHLERKFRDVWSSSFLVFPLSCGTRRCSELLSALQSHLLSPCLCQYTRMLVQAYVSP